MMSTGDLMRPPLVVRPMVHDLAAAIEETLRRNDGKPDFCSEPAEVILAKLREEWAEVLVELAATPINSERLQAEALDLAVMAGIIWQRSGGTLAAQDRGRVDVY